MRSPWETSETINNGSDSHRLLPCVTFDGLFLHVEGNQPAEAFRVLLSRYTLSKRVLPNRPLSSEVRKSPPQLPMVLIYLKSAPRSDYEPKQVSGRLPQQSLINDKQTLPGAPWQRSAGERPGAGRGIAKAGMSARKGPIPASPGGSDAEVEAGAGNC